MNDTGTIKAVRVFFALWPSDVERSELAAWQPPLLQLWGGRMTPTDKLHSTLLFIGELSPDRLQALQLAAQEVRGEAFQLVFDAAHYWGHNHIVYAAPASVPEQLRSLVKNLQLRLRQHQFNFEQRVYMPHATLLRHTLWTDNPMPTMKRVVWEMRDFALVQSLSDGQRTRYSILAKFNLKY